MKIAIFPGHIGKDSGAIDRVQGHEGDHLMTIEAVINGQVANLLKSKLDNHGVDNEIYIGSFENRLTKSVDCDLGISLHCDSFGSSEANGYTLFHYPQSKKGIGFARTIDYELQTFLSHDIKSRGLKPHSYYILAKTKFPCVLLEMGFIANPEEERKLNTYEIQNRIALALLGSILNAVCMNEKGE